MFRPNEMRSLPEGPGQFNAQEKQKWEQGLGALWMQIEKNGPDTAPHQEAKKKLWDFSKTLTQRLREVQLKKAAAASAASGRPPSQGQTQGPGTQNPLNPNNRTQPQVTQSIIDHMKQMGEFLAPPQVAPGSTEALNYIAKLKPKYEAALGQMERMKSQLINVNQLEERAKQEGKFGPEQEKTFNEQKETLKLKHSEANVFATKVRAQQKEWRAAASQANAAQQGANGTGNTSGGGAPARPGLNLQQPANPALQNTQTVNAAIENARNQQLAGGRPPQQNNGQAGTPTQSAPPAAQLPQQQAGQVQNIKQEAGVPQINTQLQRSMQNSTNSPQSAIPQSAHSVGPQSATATSVPRAAAFTHSQALQASASARTYSSGQSSGTPGVMGQHSQHSVSAGTPREANNVMQHKMPIPKFLPEKATAQPQPVPMAPARPTFSGGPNGASNGVIGQPAIPRPPGYSMDGTEDRVLNKKKLDELVKQVTGGGDGLGGEGLTPEVEEV
jgi:transcription initiation factor TFIID subunit 12